MLGISHTSKGVEFLRFPLNCIAVLYINLALITECINFKKVWSRKPSLHTLTGIPPATKPADGRTADAGKWTQRQMDKQKDVQVGKRTMQTHIRRQGWCQRNEDSTNKQPNILWRATTILQRSATFEKADTNGGGVLGCAGSSGGGEETEKG